MKNDKKYMKFKFNSDDDLPLKKTLELRNMIIIVRAVFHEDNKYYTKKGEKCRKKEKKRKKKKRKE